MMQRHVVPSGCLVTRSRSRPSNAPMVAGRWWRLCTTRPPPASAPPPSTFRRGLPDRARRAGDGRAGRARMDRRQRRGGREEVDSPVPVKIRSDKAVLGPRPPHHPGDGGRSARRRLQRLARAEHLGRAPGCRPARAAGHRARARGRGGSGAQQHRRHPQDSRHVPQSRAWGLRALLRRCASASRDPAQLDGGDARRTRRTPHSEHLCSIRRSARAGGRARELHACGVIGIARGERTAGRPADGRPRLPCAPARVQGRLAPLCAERQRLPGRVAGHSCRAEAARPMVGLGRGRPREHPRPVSRDTRTPWAGARPWPSPRGAP